MKKLQIGFFKNKALTQVKFKISSSKTLKKIFLTNPFKKKKSSAKKRKSGLMGLSGWQDSNLWHQILSLVQTVRLTIHQIHRKNQKKNRMDDAVSTKFVNLSSFKTKKETVCANKQSPILKQTLTLEG